MVDSRLERGIQAIRAGQQVLARHLLAQVVQEEPANEQAWLWLSAVVENDEQKLYCLRRVLSINPGNQAAARGVELLMAQLQLPPELQIPPPPPSPADLVYGQPALPAEASLLPQPAPDPPELPVHAVASAASATSLRSGDQETQPPRQAFRFSPPVLLAGLLSTAALVVLVVLAISWLGRGNTPPRAPSPTTMPGNLPPSPSGSISAALTPTPSRLPTLVSPPPQPVSQASDWTSYTDANDVNAVAFGQDGGMWVASTGGIVHWDLASNTYTTYTADDGLPDNNSLAIAVAPDGALWFGTRKGVSRFDGRGWTTYTSTHGLVSDWVCAIAVDSRGAIWIGTLSKGVSRYLPPK